MQPAQVIRWMVDTVSKNGTFLLDIPGKPDGTIDQKERHILEQIGAWFKINGEAIYGTRPWNVFGEGPHIVKAGSFQGQSTTGQLDASDIRYTRNKAGTVVYAIVLGWPEQDVVLGSFRAGAERRPGTVARAWRFWAHRRKSVLHRVSRRACTSDGRVKDRVLIMPSPSG